MCDDDAAPAERSLRDDDADLIREVRDVTPQPGDRIERNTGDVTCRISASFYAWKGLRSGEAKKAPTSRMEKKCPIPTHFFS